MAIIRNTNEHSVSELNFQQPFKALFSNREECGQNLKEELYGVILRWIQDAARNGLKVIDRAVPDSH